MKAAIHQTYGSPEVMFLTELEKPVPQDDELLIKIYASTANRTDAGFRSAEYIISRFWSGLFKPKYPILGSEFAGVVERCGKHVSTYQVGDQVFGYNDKSFGGHAEYITVKEQDALALVPFNITIDEAGALTEPSH